MRKNPYNKVFTEHFPLLMQGPCMTTVLTANDEQKVLVQKTMPGKKEYKIPSSSTSFTMISPPVLNLDNTENPEKMLNVEMGQTEVTQALFQTVMGWNHSNFRGPQNPVEWVTWYDCVSFCNKLSELLGLQPCYEMEGVFRQISGRENITYADIKWDESANGFRLPTEYEWRFFAKAGTQNDWSGTNDPLELNEYAWYNRNAGRKTHPVGKLRPNEWGFYDMTGNVYEFCWDQFSPYSLRTRVVLGGCHHSDPFSMRLDKGSSDLASERAINSGFRLARTMEGD